MADWVGSMAEAYDRGMGPTVFAPFATDLARRAVTRSPGRVLEVAAGSGVATRALVDALPGAAVVATDLSAAMVEVGRRRVPEATWQTADALDLPFDDDGFDLVAFQFGVMFLPDRPAGFAELRRVLRPGGTLLCSTWGTAAEHHFGDAVQTALARVRPEGTPTFLTAIPHGYHDVDVLRADVAAGGFGDVTVDTITLTGTADSTTVLAESFCTGTPLHAQLDPSERDAVVAAVVDLLGPGPVSGPMVAHVVEAVA